MDTILIRTRIERPGELHLSNLPFQVDEEVEVTLRTAPDNGVSQSTSIEEIRARLMETFGMWADRTDIPSGGIEYMDAIRRGHRLEDFQRGDETD